MKFTFTQNWNSNKAGSTENLPNQLANMLESQGYGKKESAVIVKNGVELKGDLGRMVEKKDGVYFEEPKEETKEVPKSNAKPS